MCIDMCRYCASRFTTSRIRPWPSIVLYLTYFPVGHNAARRKRGQLPFGESLSYLLYGLFMHFTL